MTGWSVTPTLHCHPRRSGGPTPAGADGRIPMSDLFPCPSCGNEVSRSALSCPHCDRIVASLGCLGNFFTVVGLLACSRGHRRPGTRLLSERAIPPAGAERPGPFPARAGAGSSAGGAGILLRRRPELQGLRQPTNGLPESHISDVCATQRISDQAKRGLRRRRLPPASGIRH